jgi:fermentation-respiration switch protein FrsA (DUF1100 family)
MEIEDVLIILGIIILSILLLFVIIGAFIGDGVSSRNKKAKPSKKLHNSKDEQRDYLDEGIANLRKKVSKEYDITSTRGDRLHGYLVDGGSNSNVYVLCIHGYRHTDGGFEFGRHSEIYLKKGYNLFLVDHQAHGQSEGKYISFGQYEHLDCLKWLKFMLKEFGENIQIILQGQSMGAATTYLLAAHKDLPSNVKLVVADCGYTSFDKELVHCAPGPKWFGSILVVFVNLFLKVFRKIDLKKTNALEAVKKITLPTIIVHGNDDMFVPTYMGKELFEACSSKDKELFIVEGAKHARSIAIDPKGYDELVTKFTDKYID